MSDRDHMGEEWAMSYGLFLRQYLDSIPGRLEEATSMLAKLDAAPGDQDALWRLSRVFHGLSGTAGTYGYPEISKVAAHAEYLVDFLKTLDHSPSSAQVAELRAYTTDIAARFGTEAETPTAPQTAPVASRQSVLVVQEDSHCAERLLDLLQRERYEVRLAGSVAEAREKVLESVPDAVLVDLRLPDVTGYQFVSWFRQIPGGEKPVVFVLSVQTRFLDKVEAISCGADAFLERPVDPLELISRLALALRPPEAAPRVLSFEDDPDQADYIRAVLESGGFEVRTCSDSTCFEADLAEFKPDLLLMDILLPNASGIDLVKYLRQSPGYVALPAVFLTALSGMRERILAIEAGGDDLLVKPVGAGTLLATVSARLKRARAQQALMDHDGLTHLLTHAAFLERAAAVFSRRARAEDSRAFVMIDLDNFKRVNDTYGHPVGDRVLSSLASFFRRRLRQADVIGRYGGEEFALILEGLGSHDVQKLLDRLREAFAELPQEVQGGSPFRCTFSVGVSMLRPSIPSVADWVAEADAALYEAKAAGRNCVRVKDK